MHWKPWFESRGGGGGYYHGVLDFLADHEQELDQLGMCPGLFRALDDVRVPTVVSAAQVAFDGVCHAVVSQLGVAQLTPNLGLINLRSHPQPQHLCRSRVTSEWLCSRTTEQKL